MVVPQPTAIQTHLSVAPVLGAADNEGPAMLQVEEEGGKDEEEEGDTPTAIALGKLVYGGGEWYPTVQRTLYILGKLYRCVPVGCRGRVSLDFRKKKVGLNFLLGLVEFDI